MGSRLDCLHSIIQQTASLWYFFHNDAPEEESAIKKP
jgi:hypothetical protein